MSFLDFILLPKIGFTVFHNFLEFALTLLINAEKNFFILWIYILILLFSFSILILTFRNLKKNSSKNCHLSKLVYFLGGCGWGVCLGECDFLLVKLSLWKFDRPVLFWKMFGDFIRNRLCTMDLHGFCSRWTGWYCFLP